MADRAGVALALPLAVWPPDDTEESVVGTPLHQLTIRTLASNINEAAAIAVPDGAPPPWKAVSQTELCNFRRPDGSAYSTLPDVFVYPHDFDDTLDSMDVAQIGPPLLIVEVLSRTTQRSDLDERQGKAWSYLDAGVREYLALDPGRSWLPEGARGWRQAGAGYAEWGPNREGRWASAALPLAFGLEGSRVAVHASDGHRFLREGEVERALRDRDQRLRNQEQRLREQEREFEAMQAEQERLRREEVRRLEQTYAADLERLRRRLDELERGR